MSPFAVCRSHFAHAVGAGTGTGVQGLLEWDMRVMMPSNSEGARAAQLETLSSHIHNMEVRFPVSSRELCRSSLAGLQQRQQFERTQ